MVRISSSLCLVWWGSDIARRQGRECLTLFVCLSITLLNDKVCERHLAMNPLEYGNDVSIVGEGNVCSCAPTFNFVSATLGGATAE